MTDMTISGRPMLAKAGAIAYVIWGLLHLPAAWSTYTLGQRMADGMERGRVL